MDTDSFTGIDLQKEYLRTLRAARVAATVGILFAAAWCWLKFQGVGQALNAIEYDVAGGFAALPWMAKFILRGFRFTKRSLSNNTSYAWHILIGKRPNTCCY